MSEQIIGINNVYKAFDEKEVHTGVNLSIERGENITVLGGSGSGKSVLLKEITGLLKPDSGDVIIEGENIVVLLFISKKAKMRWDGGCPAGFITISQIINKSSFKVLSKVVLQNNCSSAILTGRHTR